MALTADQVAHFETHGYLVAEDVIPHADYEPLIEEISAFIDQRARELKEQGEIQDLCEDADFATRCGRIYAQSKRINNGLDIMQMRGEQMFRFLRNEHLLDAVECLIGPEILCNPIQHLRAKPPAKYAPQGPDYFSNVPWHQDAGVTWDEADPTPIVTCWVPLVDATEANGCMLVMPDVWQRGQLEHVKEGGTTIEPSQLPDTEPVRAECRKGGIVFMNKFTPHCSTPNNTEGVRWSLDLRYQPIGLPTGRPFHPAFVARSRSNPQEELTDHQTWQQQWIDALEKSKGVNLHARAR